MLKHHGNVGLIRKASDHQDTSTLEIKFIIHSFVLFCRPICFLSQYEIVVFILGLFWQNYFIAKANDS